MGDLILNRNLVTTMQTYHVHFIDLDTGRNLITLADATSADAARLDVIHRYPLFSVIVTDIRQLQQLTA